MNVENITPTNTETPPFDLVKDNEDGLDIPEFLKRDKDNNLPLKKEDTETVAVQSDADFGGGEARILN